MKKCNSCQEHKELDNFHNVKSYIDGKQNTCKLCRSIVFKKYYIKNTEKVKEKTGDYYKENKIKRVKWENAKSAKDPIFKLKKQLRHRLRCAFYRLKKGKNSRTSGSAVKDLGCSISELKTHLESKWQPGMTWSNWGLYGWHIDHIRPLSSASNEQELIELCHYTNLQPLWAIDNIRKGNRGTF